jgi:hypothetical protein
MDPRLPINPGFKGKTGLKDSFSKAIPKTRLVLENPLLSVYCRIPAAADSAGDFCNII